MGVRMRQISYLGWMGASAVPLYKEYHLPGWRMGEELSRHSGIHVSKMSEWLSGRQSRAGTLLAHPSLCRFKS